MHAVLCYFESRRRARRSLSTLYSGKRHHPSAASIFDHAASITARADRHVVTMTGELCELFATRHDGVVTLSRHLTERLGPRTLFYMGLMGFGDANAAAAQTNMVASANYLATAQIVARFKPHCLLIDMGSTTTDIIALAGPDVQAELWIGAADHLLRMIRVVYPNEPAHALYQTDYSNWHLNQPVAPGAFAAANAAKATRITFEPPGPRLPPGPAKPAKQP